MSSSTSRTVVEAAVRAHYGKILAILIKQFGDIKLAEDCLQDTISIALEYWERKNIPLNQAGWLLQTARRKVIDHLRRDKNFGRKKLLLTEPMLYTEELKEKEEIPDERLRLIFTCCHPALSEQAQIGLTLKTVCGLSTTQLAHAFLVSDKTIAQRLVRAKNKIKIAGIPYEVPTNSKLDDRLNSVMSVIYLIFNEGHRSVSNENSDSVDLSKEAIYLASVLLKLLPDEPEVAGLLALMNFHFARFPARLNQQNETVSLRDQDRSRWSHKHIVKADKLLKPALMKGQPGKYQIQAAISAVHVHAPDHEHTDWSQIVLLYQKLYAYQPTPIVELNAAVALSFAHSPEAGITAIEAMKNPKVMQFYQPWYAAKADIFDRAGKLSEARQCYLTAIELTPSQSDTSYLKRQLVSLKKRTLVS